MGQGLAATATDLRRLQGAKATGTPLSRSRNAPGLFRKAGDASGEFDAVELAEHSWRKAAVHMFRWSLDSYGCAIASALARTARVSDPLASAGHLLRTRQSPDRKRQEYLRRLGIQSVSDGTGGCMPVGNQPEPNTSHEADEKVEFVSPTDAGDFRRSFLCKLSYGKVWVPKTHRPRIHNTLIIFDWDDTLLCSNFLYASKQMIYCSGPSVTRRFAGVAKAAQELLTFAKRLGETMIITNAASSWVQHSARRYLPRILPEMEGIEIISARERYELDFPNNISKWKAQTFLDIQGRRSEAITNFISIGDSSYEMDAALAIGELFPRAVVKTVKFHEKPTPEELEKELQLVSQRLQGIVESGHDLQVGLERKLFRNTDLNWGADF